MAGGDDADHPCRCKQYMVQFKVTGHSMYTQECFEVPPRYEIDENVGGLGIGAYGAVVQARDTKTGKFVAIKKWKELFDASQPLRTKSSLRELKLLRHFSNCADDHYILASHEIFIPLGNPGDSSKSYLQRKKEFDTVYVVLDLYTFSLKQLLAADLAQPLGVGHRAYFMYQLLNGLKSLFNASCVHRDLKPENLLIKIDEEDCRLAICDFGSARGYEAAVDTGITNLVFTTTQWYSPPECFLEQLQTKPDLDTQVSMPNPQAVDIWSCGAILAEMMTGEPLLPGKARDHLNQLKHIFTKVAPITREQIDQLSFRSSQLRQIMLEISEAGKDAGVRKLFAGKRDMADEAFPDLELDLLEAMLKIDPAERITIDEALDFEYFKEYAAVDRGEVPNPGKFEFRYDKITDPREDIWEEYMNDNSEVKAFFEKLEAEAAGK